jgi:hypothetical protein
LQESSWNPAKRKKKRLEKGVKTTLKFESSAGRLWVGGAELDVDKRPGSDGTEGKQESDVCLSQPSPHLRHRKRRREGKEVENQSLP